MKLKSLFLASLAAMAMVSCSNEDDQIVVNNTGEKAAFIQFGISFPAATRANDTEIGLPAENSFTDVTIVLDYGNKKVTETLTADKFQQAADGAPLLMVNPMSVEAGDNVKVYAFVNGTDAVKGIATATTIADLTFNANYNGSLDGVTAIASDKKFLMSNAEAIPEIDIKANTTTSVTVKVSRAVAKLLEKSSTDPIKVEIENTQAGSSEKIDYKGKKLSLKLVEHTYTDLNTITKVLPKTTQFTNFFQPYASTTAYVYKTNTGDAITYCLENESGTPTTVIYKAQAYWDGVAATESFYTWKDKLYLNHGELKAAYGAALPLGDEASIEAFNQIGIKKYDKGICYYKADIKTNGTTNMINRNNVYKLTVTKITKLGMTTPGGSGDDFTFLQLDVEPMEWAINLNNIVL